QVETRLLEDLPQFIQRQQPTIARKRRPVHIARAGDVARTYTRPRLRIHSGEASGWPGVRHLAFSGFRIAAHVLERCDARRVEIGLEDTRGDLGRLVGYRSAFRTPAVEAAVEYVDLCCTHDPEEPPGPRCGKEARSVIDDDGVGLRNAHGADVPLEIARRWQGVRQVGTRVHNEVVIEEDGTRDVRRLVFALAVAPLRRQ